MKKYIVVFGVLVVFLLVALAAYAAENSTWGRIKATFVDSPSSLAKVAKGQATPPGIELVVFVDYPQASLSSGGGSAFTEDFARYKLYRGGARWLTLPVSYNVNAADDVLAAVESAFETWDDATSEELFAPPGTTDKTNFARDEEGDITRDEENTVFWASFSDILPEYADAIAVAAVWFNPFPAIKEVVEFDIAFNSKYSWDIGSGDFFDVQNIATHEGGHPLFLDDLYQPPACELTMFGYSIKGEIKKRDLGLGDILGVQDLYGE